MTSYIKIAAGRSIAAVILSIVTTYSDASGTSFAHALYVVMKNGNGAAESSVPKELSLLKKTPAMLKAARTLSEGLSESESLRLADLLDRVYWNELSKRGISQSFAMTCQACLPTQFAEDINGRAIDIIRRQSDLMAAISAKPDSIIRIIDSKGSRLPTQGDRKAVIDQLMIEFSPAMSAAMKERGPDAFLQSFLKKLKENGSVEVEYDAKANGLTAAIKYGPSKARIANIDLSKFTSQAKAYIYGGALTGLGLTQFKKNETAEEKQKRAELELQRSEILILLPRADRETLMTAADTEYLLLKVHELKPLKK